MTVLKYTIYKNLNASLSFHTGRKNSVMTETAWLIIQKSIKYLVSVTISEYRHTTNTIIKYFLKILKL